MKLLTRFILASVVFYASSPMVSGQSVKGSVYDKEGNAIAYASISRSFFDGDMVVSAMATDLLNRSYLRYSIYNETGQINCLDTWPCRTARLSIRYSFNTASSRYKGRGAGISEKSRM